MAEFVVQLRKGIEDSLTRHVTSDRQVWLLVWEALFLPHTLWITFKSLALMYQKPTRLPLSYMLILCSMHTNWQLVELLDVLLNNPVALKVLVWSRGRLVTLQILPSSSFSLVEETHVFSGQCVSFSFIDVGSGFTANVVFLFFFLGKARGLHRKGQAEREEKLTCTSFWESTQTSLDSKK